MPVGEILVLGKWKYYKATSGGSRIFQRGSANHRAEGVNLLFDKILPKTAWKWKKLDRDGKGRFPSTLRIYYWPLNNLFYNLPCNQMICRQKHPLPCNIVRTCWELLWRTVYGYFPEQRHMVLRRNRISIFLGLKKNKRKWQIIYYL